MAKTADVLFLLDTTGSMGFAIDGMKQCIGDVAQTYLTSRIDIQVGLLEFRDRTITAGGDEGRLSTRRVIQFEHNDFTSNLNLFRDELDRLEADGGGPNPESSFDALIRTVDVNWRPNAHRVLILITDAPPHNPDFEVKSTDQLVDRLNQGSINQIHIVCRNQDMSSFGEISRVMTDGEDGGKHLELFFAELSVEQGKTEQLAETLRHVAKTSSDSIGSSSDDKVLKDRPGSTNPFDSGGEEAESEHVVETDTDDDIESEPPTGKDPSTNPFDDF